MNNLPLDDDGPLSTTCFDDNSQVIGTVDFEYPDEREADDIRREEERGSRAGELVALVRYLTQNTRTPLEIGKRCATLAYILHLDTVPTTQSELADSFKVSQARVSTAVKQMRRKLLNIKGA